MPVAEPHRSLRCRTYKAREARRVTARPPDSRRERDIAAGRLAARRTSRRLVPLCAALLLAAPACTDDRPIGSRAEVSRSITPTTSVSTGATLAATPTETAGTPSASPDLLAAAPVGRAGCHPASPLAPAQSVPGIETRLTPGGITGWALLWKQPPWAPGEEVKVVWRVSGNGEFAAVARGPEGVEVHPSFGPTRHAGSNYDRPGDEWGVGFILRSPGCWELRATRGKGSASIWLLVEARA